MGLINKVSGICWKCTEKEHGPDYKSKNAKSIRIFDLGRGMVVRKSPTGFKVCDVRDVLECRECGELVPLECWRSYQNTGEITIRKPMKGDRQW